MDGFQIVCTIIATVLTYGHLSWADHEYMVSSPESIMVPMDYETKITCEMNIQPDKFQWKFYPLPEKDASNPKAFISLTSSHFEIVPAHKHGMALEMTAQKKESSLIIKTKSKNIAGDYQCLAHYGAVVVASVPWRITIATLNKLPQQSARNLVKNITVVEGNTINWRCEPPEGNPEPYIDYLKDSVYITPSNRLASKILIVPTVTTMDTGRYKCKAGNIIGSVVSHSELDLTVIRSGSQQTPSFIIPPKSSYTVSHGDSVFMECAAVGNPVPNVDWKKKFGSISPERSEMVKGGLIIRNVSSNDGGVYECHHKNRFGSVSHPVTLIYNEPPRIDCLAHSPVEVTQGTNLDLDCTVTGTPEPHISWFLNGFSVINDSEIEAIGNKIYFRSVEKRHAGNLQIFARNVVNTVYKSISIMVIPLPTTQDNANDNPVSPPRRNHRLGGSRKAAKHSKMMVPPSKPTVVRLADEAVVVRWNVSMKKHGLPIKFFKVQYRELGPGNSHEHHSKGKGSKWNTIDDDIQPSQRITQVNNLKPDHWYRFRIAAVYTNDDNKNSQNSEKFFLKKMDFDIRNPLPVPLITNTETINSTAVKIYWKYDTSPNVTVTGFFVMYNSASSAGNYLRAAVDDPQARSFTLSNLQPATFYDIKLQSLYKDLASPFSPIMKAHTEAEPTTETSTIQPTSTSASSEETSGISKLYIVIAGAVLGSCGVICVIIALLLFCRKWKQKKNSLRGDRDKPGVDDHHIQADSNEYVAGSKSAPRSNGCVTPNRITITANPLADADNKNQNMIEMSCLSSQNNNCSTVQPSSSGEDSPTNSRDKKNTNREKLIRNKQNMDSTTSGENYV